MTRALAWAAIAAAALGGAWLALPASVRPFGAPAGDSGSAAVPAWELAELRRLTRVAAALPGDPYDPEALGRLVAGARVGLTPAQAEGLLPQIHEHLAALRANLAEALAAAEAGAPAAQRALFHARAAQAHGRLQRRLRRVLPAADAQRIFDGLPALVPPAPGRAPEPPAAPQPTGPPAGGPPSPVGTWVLDVAQSRFGPESGAAQGTGLARAVAGGTAADLRLEVHADGRFELRVGGAGEAFVVEGRWQVQDGAVQLAHHRAGGEDLPAGERAVERYRLGPRGTLEHEGPDLRLVLRRAEGDR